VCISCWHLRRQFCHEDEGHVCFERQVHDTSRMKFLESLTEATRTAINRATSGNAKL
jgi:hypothetical protein